MKTIGELTLRLLVVLNTIKLFVEKVFVTVLLIVLELIEPVATYRYDARLAYITLPVLSATCTLAVTAKSVATVKSVDDTTFLT